MIKIYQSWLGASFALIYAAVAIYIVWDELRHTGGGWINLRGFGTKIITAPSQLTLGSLLEALGVAKINFSEPGVSGYVQLISHILISTAFVYLLGYGLEFFARRLYFFRPGV